MHRHYFIVVLGTCAAFVFPTWSIDFPGGVAVEGQEIEWGQYKHLKGLISVEFPKGLDSEDPSVSFSELLRRYPSSGASSVFLRCQRPGTLFFDADGNSIDENEKADLKEQLEALNLFDMLPIVRLFDSDASCRLRSKEAYAKAIETFLHEFSTDNWFLLCLCEDCDPQKWETPFPIPMLETALTTADRLEERAPDLVVGAGAADFPSLEKLAASESLDVLFHSTSNSVSDKEPETIASWKGPTVHLMSAEGMSDAVCYAVAEWAGMPRLDDAFPNGYAITVDAATGPENLKGLDNLLEVLRVQVDRFQKKFSQALPPQENDKHSLKPGEAEEGFVSLFNGYDLSGWVPISKPNDFVVKEGVIELVGFGGGSLRTWEPYRDFVFRGEYWIVEGGNSGFFMRAPLAGRESRIGFEFQIAGEQPTDPLWEESTGAIYCVRPPEANSMKPGDWNEVEITCKGTEVKIVWNGQLAHHFKYEEIERMKNRNREGYIGLQDHHNSVKFRNLRIKRLD